MLIISELIKFALKNKIDKKHYNPHYSKQELCNFCSAEVLRYLCCQTGLHEH